MREIEFRAWLKNRKKMRKVCAIDFSSNQIDCSGNDEYIGWYGTNEFELMQYTGLKDRNGVKIFEGDIVECDGETCTVAWSDYYLAYTLNCKEFGYDNLGDFESKDLEVIGNIYENPELLEV